MPVLRRQPSPAVVGGEQRNRRLDSGRVLEGQGHALRGDPKTEQTGRSVVGLKGDQRQATRVKDSMTTSHLRDHVVQRGEGHRCISGVGEAKGSLPRGREKWKSLSRQQREKSTLTLQNSTISMQGHQRLYRERGVTDAGDREADQERHRSQKSW